jgi:hypothetical protein
MQRDSTLLSFGEKVWIFDVLNVFPPSSYWILDMIMSSSQYVLNIFLMCSQQCSYE